VLNSPRDGEEQNQTVLRTPWIVGPRYDLAFFLTAWLPPVLILSAAGFGQLDNGEAFFFFWIYHLFIRLPHFLAMFNITYLQHDQFAYYRTHWVRYFLVPVLIIVVYGAPLLIPAGYDSNLGFVLKTFAFLWGYQHIGMQNYGVMQIYRRRAGKDADVGQQKLEKMTFWIIIVAIYGTNHLIPTVEFFLSEPLPVEIAKFVSRFSLIAATLFSGFYLIKISRAGSLWTPATAYFCMSVMVMIAWPFYKYLPSGSWFLVFNGHHSISYFGLIFLMTWNRKHKVQTMTFRAGAREYLRFFGPLLIFSLFLILGALIYTWTQVGLPNGLASKLSLDPLLGFFVAHYYIDSQVWRFRQRHHRETILPLLTRPPMST